MIIVVYNRQLSTDIKNKNCKIKTRFVSPERPNAHANKTGINFVIFILLNNYYDVLKIFP